MGMLRTDHFTAADLATMPDDGQRYEVVRGELLVTPSPAARHQLIAGWLQVELWTYLKPHGLTTQLLMGPADITFADDTLLEPDLLVADTAAVLRSGKWTDVTTLFLVIEVISPSTARNDRTIKRIAYQRHGVPQYWIVDPDQRQVELWTPDAAAAIIAHDRLEWRHPTLEHTCTLDLVRLFDFG
jgi:Uma2 family endonuclease